MKHLCCGKLLKLSDLSYRFKPTPLNPPLTGGRFKGPPLIRGAGRGCRKRPPPPAPPWQGGELRAGEADRKYR